MRTRVPVVECTPARVVGRTQGLAEVCILVLVAVRTRVQAEVSIPARVEAHTPAREVVACTQVQEAAYIQVQVGASIQAQVVECTRGRTQIPIWQSIHLGRRCPPFSERWAWQPKRTTLKWHLLL